MCTIKKVHMYYLTCIAWALLHNVVVDEALLFGRLYARGQHRFRAILAYDP